MLEWVLKLIDLKKIPMKSFLDLSEIVRYACLKPQLLGRCLAKLEEWELLESGLQSNIRIQNEECGLLTWLCYADVNIPPACTAKQPAEIFTGPSQNGEKLEKLVGKLIENTKEDFLHGPFNGYLAWHYAQQHGNDYSQQSLTSRFQNHYPPSVENYALKIVHEVFRKMPVRRLSSGFMGLSFYFYQVYNSLRRWYHRYLG